MALSVITKWRSLSCWLYEIQKRIVLFAIAFASLPNIFALTRHVFRYLFNRAKFYHLIPHPFKIWLLHQ